jgi:hypothetical protein
VIAQVVVGIGDEDIKNDTPPQLLHIRFWRGPVGLSIQRHPEARQCSDWPNRQEH